MLAQRACGQERSRTPLLPLGGCAVNADDAIQILLAEDNPGDAELTVRALARADLPGKVHWVGDGAAALEFVLGAGRSESRALKLILLDLQLRKVDGIEVLRRLKADTDTRAIPVVVMLSPEDPRRLAESYRLGANSCIVKPISCDAFMETVAEVCRYWLRQNRGLRPPDMKA